jgi:uncharacterized integral membrane protein
MIKLISFIIVFTLFLVFITLNLGHNSDISFGFHTFYDIPVFLSVLASFSLGMLFAIPLAISINWKKKKNKSEIQGEAPENDKINKEVNPYGIN